MQYISIFAFLLIANGTEDAAVHSVRLRASAGEYVENPVSMRRVRPQISLDSTLAQQDVGLGYKQAVRLRQLVRAKINGEIMLNGIGPWRNSTRKRDTRRFAEKFNLHTANEIEIQELETVRHIISTAQKSTESTDMNINTTQQLIEYRSMLAYQKGLIAILAHYFLRSTTRYFEESGFLFWERSLYKRMNNVKCMNEAGIKERLDQIHNKMRDLERNLGIKESQVVSFDEQLDKFTQDELDADIAYWKALYIATMYRCEVQQLIREILMHAEKFFNRRMAASADTDIGVLPQLQQTADLI